MASAAGSLERLALEIGDSLKALAERFQPDSAEILFESLGFRPPGGLISEISDELGAGASAASNLTTFVDDLRNAIDASTDADPNVEAIIAAGKSLVTAIEGVIGAVRNLSSVLDNLGGSFPGLSSDEQAQLGQFGREFLERLLGLLMVELLENRVPRVQALAELIGLIEFVTSTPGAGDRFTTTTPRPKLRLDRLHLLVTNPSQYLSDVFGWGQADFDGALLLGNLRTFLEFDVDVPATFIEVPGFPRVVEAFLYNIAVDAQATPPGLKIDLRIEPEGAFSQTLPLTEAWELLFTLSAQFARDVSVGVQPPFALAFLPSAGTTASVDLSVGLNRPATAGPLLLLGQTGGSRVEVGRTSMRFGLKGQWDGASGGPSVEPSLSGDLTDGRVIITAGESDGFLDKVLEGRDLEGRFDLGFDWSPSGGLEVRGAGKLEVTLPTSISVGPVRLSAIHLGIGVGANGLTTEISATADATLGPVAVAVDRIGVSGDLSFPSNGGNLGLVDLAVGFKPPTGLGISVNAGAISGGGFLKFEPDIGRYSGAVQLSIYSVSVGAFGIIETKFPDGRSGFSFVIVISAEFPGIQLGFGFTLLGVGGIIGINRGLDANELGRLVLAGESGHLLFPMDVVANAPAIIRDLGAVFPAREGRYVFGPLAKLGWGTPTLVRGELGLILELPGPTLTILGEVRVRLPKEELALASFNMSVLGFLDFPRKSFGLNAALHDSIINGYPVSGQMAMRVRWGEEPNFVLSVGGFHPAYKPPPDFPKLQPLTLDLGKSDSVSVTVSGFFAVTSNTLQIGGDARLHASGSGISLDATLGVKALFIFTPFSFEAIIDASVKISFHGRGPSVHLHGVLSGPTPWRARGELCVSILFWDACLGFDEEFGGGKPVSVLEIDPWTGSAGPPEVIGLKQALDDPASWSTDPPPGALSVVTLAEGSKDLVDPLGVLIVRERIVPVETENPIARFGVAKVAEPIKFKLLSATLQGSVPLVKRGEVEDFFAPAQYFELDDAKKLSAKSYEKHQAGYRLAANDRDLQLGSKVSFEPAFETLIIAADGSATPADPYVPTEAHVDGSTTRSAVALFGTLQLGTRRYIDPRFTQPFGLPAPTFQLAHVANLFGSGTAPPAASRTEALLLYAAFIRSQPEQRGRFQVVASHEIRGI